MRGIQVGALALSIASAALASTAFAQVIDQARLDGEFSTQDESQESDGANEVCFSFDDDDDIEVDGQVQNPTGGCLVTIGYDTDAFTSASGKALKPGQTAGTAKLSQSIFVDMSVAIEGCLLDFVGEARIEKCSVSASLKGTQVPDTEVEDDNDIVDSLKASVKCELGEDLAEIDTDDVTPGIQPPTQEQADAVVGAFSNRSDVKLASSGKLQISHTGIRDDDTPRCED